MISQVPHKVKAKYSIKQFIKKVSKLIDPNKEEDNEQNYLPENFW